MVGKTSRISPARCASSAPAGVNQPSSTHSSPSTRGSWPGGGGEEEVGVEARADDGGGDPARELDELRGGGQLDAGLLAQLAHGGGAVGAVVLPLGVLDGAAGKHPHAAHEARAGGALDEQQLEALGRAAQQDHGGGLAGGRGIFGARPPNVLLAGTGPLAGDGAVVWGGGGHWGSSAWVGRAPGVWARGLLPRVGRWGARPGVCIQ